MGLAYLTTETATLWLERDGILVPDELESMLGEIEAQIDNWLYWRPALTLYDKEPPLKLKARGKLFLTHTPVVTIVDVQRQMYSDEKGTDAAIAEKLLNPFAEVEDNKWETIRRWTFDGRNMLVIEDWRGWEGDLYNVRYWAGLHPLPSIFELVAYRVLKETIDYGGSMEWMYLPTIDDTSLSLPGGLSSSKKVGDTKDVNQRDRLFQDLKQYRRRQVLI